MGKAFLTSAAIYYTINIWKIFVVLWRYDSKMTGKEIREKYLRFLRNGATKFCPVLP
ncbi:hypothetical protein N752_18930 [Desulforamulus aquiferis]|nr:hypothetical protein N752_18930 [Desulforamulus aquiferis]